MNGRLFIAKPLPNQEKTKVLTIDIMFPLKCSCVWPFLRAWSVLMCVNKKEHSVGEIRLNSDELVLCGAELQLLNVSENVYCVFYNIVYNVVLKIR